MPLLDHMHLAATVSAIANPLKQHISIIIIILILIIIIIIIIILLIIHNRILIIPR